MRNNQHKKHSANKYLASIILVFINIGARTTVMIFLSYIHGVSQFNKLQDLVLTATGAFHTRKTMITSKLAFNNLGTL